MSTMTDTVPGDLEEHAGRRWAHLCDLDDLSDDEGRRVETTPPVSVYRSDGEYFCIDDTCSHETYPLSEGWVENCVVECPLHVARFSLRSGAPLSGPTSTSVGTHPIAIVNGSVFAALPESYSVTTGHSADPAGASG